MKKKKTQKKKKKKSAPKRQRKTILLWGRKLERSPIESADQWWFEKNEPLGAPTVRVNLYRYPGETFFWTVELLGPHNVLARCTGQTLEGCVDHLNETGVPAKWFPGRKVKR
jgi:hypothetical protein